MNEKLKTVVTTVKTKWTDASKMAKILIISIPVVVIAIIIVLCVMLNSNKSTAVLFRAFCFRIRRDSFRDPGAGRY